MRALLDILKDEQRILCSINSLREISDFTSDKSFMVRLECEKENYEDRLKEIHDEIKEYFEMLNT